MSAGPVFGVGSPGLLSTFQDLGRTGFQYDGVPVSGAMDPWAASVANLLAGNARGAAVLEITLLGPVLTVLAECVVALTGADLSAHLDGEPLPLWKSVRLRAGRTLRFGRPRAGARTYLAVAGGFDVPLVLGSRSTYGRGGFGGLDGRPLRTGDLLARGPAPGEGTAGRALCPADIPDLTDLSPIRILPGPQASSFTRSGWRAFLASPYVVSPQSDRMGYRLDGPRIGHRRGVGADIVSEPNPPGAIQVTAAGAPILLMADRQTTGGYTKIATVISVDLPRVAQRKPGDLLRFARVTPAEARDLLLRQERFLRFLELAAVQRV